MYPRWYWRAFALPGVVWLILFVAVPFYTTLAVAMGTVDPIFFNPIPAWNPIDWNVGYLNEVITRLQPPNGAFWVVSSRTFEYVAISLGACIAIGYPVAYYIARHAGRTKSLLLLLLLLPFWVSYLMRMLAWIGLLQSDGYVNRLLVDLHITNHPPSWLDGQPSSVVWGLIYGYIPYFIVPLYASLDRIDQRLIEAARDLGASPMRTFFHVTLPLSKQGLLAGAVLITLPMFGDYYTADLLSGAPRTNMIGNQINIFVQGGTQKNLGASLVITLSAFLMILMLYYLRQTAKATRQAEAF
jgi:putrescine transport system permease protein